MKRVYFASKLYHASTWRNLKDARVHAFARWLVHEESATEDSAEEAKNFWIEDVSDVKVADAVVVYAAYDDKLRGALVEAGVALAMKVPVYVIGEHPDYGTWQYHPGVIRCDELEEALHLISLQVTR